MWVYVVWLEHHKLFSLFTRDQIPWLGTVSLSSALLIEFTHRILEMLRKYRCSSTNNLVMYSVCDDQNAKQLFQRSPNNNTTILFSQPDILHQINIIVFQEPTNAKGSPVTNWQENPFKLGHRTPVENLLFWIENITEVVKSNQGRRRDFVILRIILFWGHVINPLSWASGIPYGHGYKEGVHHIVAIVASFTVQYRQKFKYHRVQPGSLDLVA